MKKFNEWLSFRSNSYQENEIPETPSAFDFGKIPGAQNVSGVKRAEERLHKFVDMYGVRNKRLLLADIIKDVYDFSAPEEMDKLKRDLRYLSTHLEKNNNLDMIETPLEDQE